MGAASAADIALSVVLFGVAGLMEVGGGWLVWQTVREGKPWWYSVIGGAALVGYGFVPCAQPDAVVGAENAFGRVYAAYGGFFIVLYVRIA